MASNISLLQEKYQQNYISISGIYPGAKFAKIVKIFNPYNEDHIVGIRSVDVAGALDFFPLKDLHDNQTSIGRWIADTPLLTIPALGSTNIALAVTVPTYAPLGNYAGGLLVDDLTTGDLNMKMRVYFTIDEDSAPKKEIAPIIEPAQSVSIKKEMSARLANTSFVIDSGLNKKMQGVIIARKLNQTTYLKVNSRIEQIRQVNLKY